MQQAQNWQDLRPFHPCGKTTWLAGWAARSYFQRVHISMRVWQREQHRMRFICIGISIGNEHYHPNTLSVQNAKTLVSENVL